MEKKPCLRSHVNQLWSVWYGLTITGFQSYIAVRSAKRLLEWLEYPWEEGRLEIEASLLLTGLAVVLLPLFLCCSLFKVANYSNDGFKLGQSLTTCSQDRPPEVDPSGGLKALWRHGGPTAPFIHLVSAFSLLLPNLLLEAKFIKADLLPKEDIWKTDLDFLISSYDRLVVLSFMTSPHIENNTAKSSTSIPFVSSSPATQGVALASGQKISSSDGDKIGPVSIEFFNYALALAVYAVRYPAVFWNTNKCWGAIFSFQLFINGIQNLFVYVGVCILYKIHVVGASVLTSLPMKIGNHYFLLNPLVTLALLVLTSTLVLSSSLVLYFYGYGRYNAFLNHEKACRIITVEGKEWGYLTHCAALCVLLAITVVEGPLLVDLAVIYKSTLDTSVLISVIVAVFHLFIWVVLWLILTLKQNWEFKLRVTIGKAAVKSARSIKLLTDVELLSSCDSSAPLLVVASGRTYTVCDTSPKKTIINVIHKAAMERKARLQAGVKSSSDKGNIDDNDEQIYWLRPKPITPKNSPDSEVSDHVSWQKKTVLKPKVTFDQSVTSNTDLREDDGDYARLRELPFANSKISPQHEIYIKSVKMKKAEYTAECEGLLVPTGSDYEDPSPLITPEPPDLPPPPPSDTPVMPRCLLRGDSGMPHDLTPRSDSDVSGSPPDHSETSSGVHSNSSRDSHTTGMSRVPENNPPERKPNQQWNNGLAPKDQNSQLGEVVIRRRIGSEVIAVPNTVQDKFERCTNMRMTSFTDGQSATLPHFPTQQVGVPYSHCSTMPLPPPVIPAPVSMNYAPNNFPRHSTIPTHHNGVRLFTPNPYGKRPFVNRYPQHHSFPQLMSPMKFHLRHSERDSANFSMTSSGESDTYHS